MRPIKATALQCGGGGGTSREIKINLPTGGWERDTRELREHPQQHDIPPKMKDSETLVLSLRSQSNALHINSPNDHHQKKSSKHRPDQAVVSLRPPFLIPKGDVQEAKQREEPIRAYRGS